MITIDNLTKFYGNNRAVNHISFTINDNEILGFLGPNGAGKSTTMNMIAGYLPMSDGTVNICGSDINKDPIKAKSNIGYLPEIPPVYPDMKVKEYLSFCAGLKRVPNGKRKDEIDRVMGLLKIKDVEGKLIRNLSKGYKQRVGFAQALLGDPKFLILDEPTVGLDPKQIIEIRNLIRSLGKEHTVILSTHILQEVQAVCDRIVIINKGKIVANEKTENIALAVDRSHRFNAKICGPQNDVLAALRGMSGVVYAEALAERDGDALTYTVESERGVDIRKKLFYLLAERGWALIGMESLGMNLEDIFISVVDRSDERKTRVARGERRRRGAERTSAEREIGEGLYEEAKRQREEAALQETDEDDA